MPQHTDRAYESQLGKLRSCRPRDGRPRRGPDRPGHPRAHRAGPRLARRHHRAGPHGEPARRRDRRPVAQAPRPAPAGGARPAPHHHRPQDHHRPRAHRRPRHPHRRAGASSSRPSRRSSPTSTSLAWRSSPAAWCIAASTLSCARTSSWRSRCARSDDAIDRLHDQLFRELLSFMVEDPQRHQPHHAPALRLQVPRAHRRPRHQHRRDGDLPGEGPSIRHMDTVPREL